MSDLFEMEERLAGAVVGELRISLAAGPSVRIVRQPTDDLEAYNLYLRGRYHWMRRPRETRKGLEYFERAIARDPLFALAHAGVADAYNTLGSWEAAELPSWEAFPRAHAAAMQALSLDPALAEAHTPLAYANMHYRWRWDEAGEDFGRALALDPAYSHAHHWHSHWHMAQGRVAESLDASRRAIQRDPLDVVINVHLAWHYWFAREYDAAIEQAAQTAELDSTSPWPAFFAGMASAALGDTGAAIHQHRLALERGGESPVMYGALGYSLAAGGERPEAERVLRHLYTVAERQSVSSYEIAVIHGTLGDRDRLFDWLDRAYEERSAWLAYLAVDPRLDSVRDDERFRALLRAVGLDRRG
jgi:serine/threonine-protein kinase